MESLLRPLENQSRMSFMSHRQISRPETRLDMDIFNSLTHNSVPMTAEVDGKQNASVQSGWDKYVREMNIFYFCTLCEVIEAYNSA